MHALLRTSAATTLRTALALGVMVGGSLVFGIAVHATPSAYYVTDPVQCPSEDDEFPGQKCSGGLDICGYVTTPTGDVAQCYDTSTMADPSSPATSNTQYSGVLGGGFVLNCFAAADAAAPFCDNAGAWLCNRASACYTTKQRDTTCAAPAGDVGAYTCGSCRTGYQDCLGDDACEVQTGITNYPTGANNNYAAACGVQCDTGYLDCDASGAGAGNGCEIQDGAACTVGSVSGTYDGCTCVPQKNYFETGTNTSYGTGDPLLWGTQYGTGKLVSFNDDTRERFAVFNDGLLFAEGGLSTSGSLTWEGAASGASLWVSTFEGAGLADCDLATDKIVWDATTKRFACATDLSVGTGLDVGTGDDRYVNVSGDTMTGALTIDLQGTEIGVGLEVIETVSGSTIFANRGLSTSGSLAWEGAASGASLYVAASLRGSGLTDCDISTQKLQWDATTGRFSCGTDQNGGMGTSVFSGSVLTILRNYTGSLLFLRTVSGTTIHANTTLTSSGSVTWETFASGSSIWVSTFSGAGLTDCDLSTQKLLYDAQTEKFVCSTDQIGGFGTNVFSGAILRLIQNFTGSMLHVNTISGSTIHANTTLSSSGGIVWEGAASGASLWVSTFSGAGLADCDLSTQKLLYDAQTERFTCGTDQEGAGSVSAGQGLSKNGSVLTLNASISGSLLEFQTVSGALVYGKNTLASSGALVWEGAASGATLTISGQFDGAGLTDCDADNQSLSWDATTKRFICGDDDTGGSSLTAGQGLALNGSVLVLNGTITGSLLEFQTVSGALVYARNTLASSGTLVVEGDSIMNGNAQLGDDTSDIVSMNGLLGSSIFLNANNSYQLGDAANRWASGNFAQLYTENLKLIGMSECVLEVDLDGDVFCGFGGGFTAGQGLNSTSNVIMLNSSISGSLLEFQTVSGALVYGKNTLASSGALVWEGAASGATLTISGQFDGAGLTDCDADNQSLSWDATTKRFSCGDDDTGGSSLTAGQGLALNGSVLVLNGTITGSLLEFQTVSGAMVYAERQLSVSGSVTLGEDAADNVVFNADVNSNILPNANNSFDFGSSSARWANGWFINANLSSNLSVLGTSSLTGNVGIGTANTTTKAALSVSGTASGTTVYAVNALRSSGALVWEGAGSGSSLYAGTLGIGIGSVDSGLKLEIAGTASGRVLYAQQTIRSSGSIVLEGTLSGANVFGFGLATDCDASSSKLVWDATTGRFGCNSINAGQGLSYVGGSTLQLNSTFSGTLIARHGVAFMSGGYITTLGGWAEAIHFPRSGLATAGIVRLDANGDLRNIGTIQAGQTQIRRGGTFLAKQDYTTALGAYDLAIADFNGDAKMDFVTANNNAANASVFLNTGTGGFYPKADYTAGTNPQSVAVGDINGDGRQDFVTANFSSASVSILLNRGTGSFMAKTDVTVGTQPQSVAIGDVNNDSKPDIVTGNFGGQNISVLINRGSGSFMPKVDYSMGFGVPFVTLGDTNGDSRLDIIAANYTTSVVSVFPNIGNGTFGAKVNYPVGGSNPSDVVAADFNGDDKIDFATANYDAGPGNTVSVRLNSGTGGFLAKTNYTVGSGPFNIAAGDLNGDGYPDIVTSNATATNTVSVLMNNGNGTFATKTDITVASSKYAVGIGDFNADGRSDIVAAGIIGVSDSTASVLMNQAQTVFVAGVGTGGVVGIGTATPGSALSVSGAVLINPNGTISNARADAGLALEIIGTASGRVLYAQQTLRSSGSLVWEGAGSGSSLYAGTLGIGIGSVDSGLKLEIAGTASGRVLYAQQTIRSSGSIVLEGTLSGANVFGFGLATDCDTGASSKLLWDATTGRFSCGTDQTGGSTYTAGQGLTLTSSSFKLNSVITGSILRMSSGISASGNIISVGDITTKSGAFVTRYGLVFMSGALVNQTRGFNQNFNIVASGLSQDGVQRMNNVGNLVNIGSIQAGETLLTRGGTFQTSVSYATGTTPLGVAIGDVNGDGKADVAVANTAATSVSVFINNGDGTYSSATDYSANTSPQFVAIGDLNGDGKADMAVTNFSSNLLSVYLNNGNGSFAAKVDYATAASPKSLAMGDLNGDGRADIAVVNSNATSVSVFMNSGNGRFASKVDYTTGANPFSVAIGDLNGDGNPDMAVANSSSDSVSVLLNRSNGTFATKVDYTTGTTPYAVAIGDLNGDGEADMAVANNGSTSVSVFLHNFNGTFATKVDYATGTAPSSVVIGDLNGDGEADIATEGTNSISVFQNNGNGTFVANVDTSAVDPRGMAIGELNGDGKLDLAVTSGGNNLLVYINDKRAIFYAATGTGGAVGIGTFTPGSALSVSGAMIINPNGTITNTRADAGLALEVIGTASGRTLFAQNALRSSGSLVWEGAGSGNALIVSSTLGIGTGTVDSGLKLEIAGTASGRVLYAQQALRSSGSLVWEGAGSGSSLYVGSLGIGTTPDSGLKLEVAGTASGRVLFAQNVLRSSGSVVTESGAVFDGGTMYIDANSNRIGISTSTPAAQLHINSPGNQNTNFFIDANGTQDNQSGVLGFVTLGDGSKALNSASTKGWLLTTRGNAWSTSDQQNDFELDYWDGSSYRRSMHVDSVTGYMALGPQTVGSFVPDSTIEVLGTASGFTVFATDTLSTSGALIVSGTGRTVPLIATSRRYGTIMMGTGAMKNGTGSMLAQLYVTGRVPSRYVGSGSTASMSPTAVAVQGRHLYVAGGSILQVFNIDVPTKPRLVGSLSGLSNAIRRIKISGNTLVLSSESATSDVLQTVNVSNPASPSLLGTLNVTNNYAHGMDVQGTYAYLGGYNASNETFRIIDLANPGKPSSIATVTLGSLATPKSVTANGRYVYVTDSNNSNMQVIDVLNPKSPTSVTTVSTGTTPVDSIVQGNYLYVANYGGASVSIFDVSTPASPVLIGTATVGTNPQQLSIQGRYLYVTNGGDNTAQVVDVSNPRAPVSIGTVATGVAPAGIIAQGRYAYVANTTSKSLLAFDLGGAYIQQLDAGGIATAGLDVLNDARVQQRLDVRGSISAGNGLNVNGNSTITGTGTDTLLTLRSSNNSSTTNVFKIISNAVSNDNLVFRVTASGGVYTDAFYNSAGADYAEWFFTSTNGLAPGEVVCVDTTKPNTVKRCERDGDDNVMGIVSTKPAFVGNVLSGADGLPVPNTALVGLIGQVPAKVIVSGGSGSAIRPGDSLTAASRPGYARKARPGESTVGVALEGLQAGEGVVNVLISRRNQSLTVSAVEDEVIKQIQAMEIEDEVEMMVAQAMGDLNVDRSIIDEVGRQVDALNVRDAIAEEVARQLDDTIDDAGCDSSNAALRWDPDTGRFSCGGETFGSPETSASTGSSGTLVGSDLIASTLWLTSTLAVDGDARIAGALHLDGALMASDIFVPGVMAVDGSLTSSSLTVTGDSDVHGTLTLHGPLVLGSGSSLEFGSGLTLADLVVQRSLAVLGDVTIDGLTRFLGDVAVEGELVVARQAGHLMVPAGATGATFAFEPAFVGQPVVTASPNVPVLYAVSIATSSGFTVSLAAPAERAVTFSWVALIIPSAASGGSGSGLSFPVDDAGVPVSSSLQWNACIRGVPLFDASGIPYSCSRYHDGTVWYHPDSNLSFVWNDAVTPPYMELPEGYVSTVTETSASVRSAIDAVNAEQGPSPTAEEPSVAEVAPADVPPSQPEPTVDEGSAPAVDIPAGQVQADGVSEEPASESVPPETPSVE